MFSITYPLTALGVCLVLIVYALAIVAVGRMRGKHGVKVPAVTGDPEFERAYRAHQNMVEGLVMFLPLVLIFAMLFGDVFGGLYAVIFAVGRYMYQTGYVKQSEKRAPGFMIATFSSLGVLIACIGGIIWQLLS